MNRRHLKVIVATFWTVVISVATIGCAEKSNRAQVTGNVSLDGQPLKSGNIRFVPEDGATATADAQISDGRYLAKVPRGNKRVSITAPKIVGTKRVYETPDSPTVNIVEELLPARYNIQTELTLSVENGSQTKDFDLKSAK